MPKTLRRRKANRKSSKRLHVTKLEHPTTAKKSQIVRHFLEILTTVKLYHWKTRSFAQHKATDELYDRLNGHIDKFVEVLLGKDESRVSLLEQKLGPVDSKDKDDFKQRIFAFRHYLTEMHLCLDPIQDTDLLSIRDEILADINQFLYLMTFDQ
uniref:Uncharacterized protein n=1 Tax=viral metagenome TaxID=1070528 RepID=A0A6C0I4A8_9ZZZZ